MQEKCPYCATGVIENVSYGDREWESDDWCSNDDCLFNEGPKERADDRWQDYLENTWEDDDGERHYY